MMRPEFGWLLPALLLLGTAGCRTTEHWRQDEASSTGSGPVRKWLLFSGGDDRFAVWHVAPASERVNGEICGTTNGLALVLADMLSVKALVCDPDLLRAAKDYVPVSPAGLRGSEVDAAEVLAMFASALSSQANSQAGLVLLPPLDRSIGDNDTAVEYVDQPVIALAHVTSADRLRNVIALVNHWLYFMERASPEDLPAGGQYLPPNAGREEVCEFFEKTFTPLVKGGPPFSAPPPARVSEIGSTGVLLFSFSEPFDLATWCGGMTVLPPRSDERRRQ